MISRYTKSCRMVITSLFLLVGLIFSFNANAQTATATCSGIGAENNFKIVIDGMSSSTTYNVFIDDVIQGSVLTSGGTFTSNDIAFVDGTASYEVKIKNTSSPLDSMIFVVHEQLCTDIDDDGTMDFNTAGCDYTKPIGTGGVIVSTVAPYNSDHVYLYVLSDTFGDYSAIYDTSKTGYFENLANGSYRISAYHFMDEAAADVFVDSLNSAAIKDIDNFSSMSNPVCYNFCGNAQYTVDCECLVSIDTHPDNETTCDDGDATFYVEASVSSPMPDGDSLAYKWERSIDNGSTFAAASIGTDSTLELTGVTFSDSGYQYRVVVTLLVNGTEICKDTSTAGILNVDPLPELEAGLTATVCADETSGIVLSVASGSVAASSYNIVSIDSSGLIPSAGSPDVGVTTDANALSDDAWANTTGSDQTITYNIAPSSGDGCIGDTVAVTITVKSAPVYAGPDMVTVCSDEASGATLPTTDDNSNTIDSFIVSASLGSNLTGSATSGNTILANFIALDSFNNVSGAVDTVTYTVTPFSGDCVGADFTIYVIVNPEPLIATDIVEESCSDVAIAVDLPFSDDNSLGIDSVSITALVGTGLSGTASDGDGITTVDYIASDEFTNTSSAIDSVVYTVTPYAGTCVGESFDIIVRITPEPVGSDPMEIVCSDEAVTITLTDLITNGTTVDSFTWIATANANITAESTTLQETNTITETLTNISGSIDTVVYTVTPLSKAGTSGCIGDPFTVSIIVRPEPVADPGIVTVCSDEALDFSLTDQITQGLTVKGFLYTVDVAGVSARVDTSSGNITDVFTNTSSSDSTVIYTVTPISDDGCVGDDFTVTVTITPEPIMDMTLGDTLCSSSAIGVILAVEGSSVAADSFTIVSITVPSGLTADGSNATIGTYSSSSVIASDMYENTTTGGLNVTYRVSAMSSAGCQGDEIDIIVRIDAEPEVDAGEDETICSNADVDLTLATITGGGSSGVWSTIGGTPASDSLAFGNDIAFGTVTTFTPSADNIAAGSVTLVLTSSDASGTCTDVSDERVVTINDVECATFPWNGN